MVQKAHGKIHNWIDFPKFFASFIVVYFALQLLIELCGHVFSVNFNIPKFRKKLNRLGLFAILFFLIAPGCTLSVLSGEWYLFFIVPIVIFEALKEIIGVILGSL